MSSKVERVTGAEYPREVGNGRVSATLMVEYRTGSGEYCHRRMRIANDFNVTQEQAQGLVNSLREYNQGMHILGSYSINL
jgi:hypothetical protein